LVATTTRDQCPRDQSFVVAGVVVIEAVRVGRVEQGDAAVEGGVQEFDAARLVAIGFSGQPHAPHPDRSRRTRLRSGSGVFWVKRHE